MMHTSLDDQRVRDGPEGTYLESGGSVSLRSCAVHNGGSSKYQHSNASLEERIHIVL
jgi:hypothetical protein